MTTDPFDGLFDLAVETYDKLTAQAEQETPMERPLACAKGCASCCYQPAISVTPIEIFHIVSHVRNTFSEAKLKGLQERLKAPGISLEYGGMKACCFLENNLCSIHQHRPFACRSANSYDQEACLSSARQARTGRSSIPIYKGHLAATQLVLNALYKAVKETDLENGLFDLQSAMAIALNDPKAEKKWRKGKKVFGSKYLPGRPKDN